MEHCWMSQKTINIVRNSYNKLQFRVINKESSQTGVKQGVLLHPFFITDFIKSDTTEGKWNGTLWTFWQQMNEIVLFASTKQDIKDKTF